ncbi:serine/threonine-protein kinase 32b [Plakobranchus ocellatus]|uniref:Serine/threonine-protein kinase 32b n=1 Tax=Plakobranchus ocellatus TaxID=259542 RepID=A0AAV4DB94_9GAST|nr:serine/threonine-protein kinase 32b [Plakobranchus ocellatus]
MKSQFLKDNLIEKWHVHITDFNIASEMNANGMATSLSGTKPYMAPEIFSAALGEADGYSFAVDWWALGVTIFELLKKRRPFAIHGDTSPQETLHILVNTNIHYPSSASESLNNLLKQLLSVDPQQRLQTADRVKSHPAMASVDFECVKAKKTKPLFVPSNEQLNCDPTYELEEMIIETKPLHKKKKRLAKQLSKKDSLSSDNASTTREKPDLFKDFPYYNRDADLAGKKSPPAPPPPPPVTSDIKAPGDVKTSSATDSNCAQLKSSTGKQPLPVSKPHTAHVTSVSLSKSS